MSFRFFGSLLVLTFLFKFLASQQPNTDGFFVSDFLQKMGVSSEIRNYSSSVCSWEGVHCNRKKENVISLVISGLGLSGFIPENTIGKLSKLHSLDLSNNNITGFSSDFWALGKSLRNLNLSCNQINGSLSSNIGNFGQLKSLDLSCNNFSGEIPASLTSLSGLHVLNLSRNMFGGGIPNGMLHCAALVSIDLSSNGLVGRLPNGFGAAFANLTALSLADNEIHSGVSDLSGLKSITYLNLSGNQFQGSLKDVFQQPLQVIDLSKNQFQGYISQVHSSSGFNWSTLIFLDLSENQLSGEFFNELSEAQALKHLNLAHNRFTKQKFPRIGNLLDLQHLNLSKTSLMGPIPTEFLKLSNLTTLDLSRNHLTGHVPDLSRTNLQVLDLSHNNLTGIVPLSLVEKLPEMGKFNFSYNNLTLCASRFSPETFRSSFYGSLDDCPIATDPALFRRKAAKHRGFKLALALALSIFCFLVGLLCLAFGCRKKTRMWAVKQLSHKEETKVSGPFSFETDSTTWTADVKVATSVPVIIFDKPLLNFTFQDLLSATSHFDRGTLLAEGRFGPVYRGFLPGGIHVAVKVLVHGSTMTDEEAARELEHLGRIKHANLVPLIGYCLAGEQRIAIYEYMENGNLQNLLHDLPLGVQRAEDWSTDTWEEDNAGVEGLTSEGLTTWPFRHKIALGTARALAFLHHGCFPQIIHRDVKASSVYLGPALEPRLSDFGLCKIFGTDLEEELCRGSPGYTPPELETRSESCSLTAKSDVYGFGVILFELITGKKPLGDNYPDEKDTNLVNWVRGLVRRNQGAKVIDSKIRGTGSETQIVEALRIGYLCTADLPSKRPSMQQIVGLLKDIDPSASQ